MTMHRISSVRSLLSMDEKYHWTFTVTILFSGIVLNGNLCESLCKNVLIVNDMDTFLNGCIFPSCCSGAAYPLANETKICARSVNESQTVNAGCCPTGNSDCTLEIRKHGNNVSLTLNEDTLSHQDIMVIFHQSQISPSMFSACYNKSSDFYSNYDNFTREGKIKGIKITKNNTLCGKDSPYDQPACEGKSSMEYILNISSDGGKRCVSCNPPVKKPELNLTLAPLQSNNDGTINAEKAAEVMKTLYSLLEKMGNASTAAIIMGNVKGLINKLPLKNQKDVTIGLSPDNDMSIVVNENVLKTSFSRLVHISKEASVMAVQRNSSFFGVLVFQNMSKDEKNCTVLYNEVMGIDMGTKISNLSDSVDIHYRNVDKKGANAFCNSWNGEGNRPNWTTEGCETKESNNSIVCQCTHLTFFAILMSPPPGNISSVDVTALTYITSIGCGLSLLLLTAALFVQFLIRKGKPKQDTKILTNHLIAMFFLNLTFLVNEQIANLGVFGACVAIAAAMHYALLATFTWCFMEALHLYLQLRNVPAQIKHYMMKICITGWVTPAPVVIAIAAMGKYDLMVINTDDGNSVKMCWISDRTLHNGVNIGYYAVVFIFTFSMFILITRLVLLAKPRARTAPENNSIKTNSLSILGLLILLGITWAVAFFSHGPLIIPSYYIFTILNSFQGCFLFFYHYYTSKSVEEDRGSTSNATSIATNIQTTSSCLKEEGTDSAQ